jgi:tight adherence protein B
MMLPEPDVLLAAVISGGIGLALVLLIVGIRGTIEDPAKPPSHLERLVASLRSPAVSGRVVLAVLVAVVVLTVTRWPVAALGIGALVLLWPMLFGGARVEARAMAQLEALVSWTEQLHDTVTAHVGLEQAIPTTAQQVAPAIREPMERLIGRVEAKVPLERALLGLAQDIDDPASADLIITALKLNAKNRGSGLTAVLENLAAIGRETLTLRRKVAAQRAVQRRTSQLMVLITLGVACFLVLFSPAFIQPYRTAAGEAALAIVIGLFAAGFAVMRKLCAPERVMPFLPREGSGLGLDDYAVIAALTSGSSIIATDVAQAAETLR